MERTYKELEEVGILAIFTQLLNNKNVLTVVVTGGHVWQYNPEHKNFSQIGSL